jgi:hypothetical protein
MIRAMFNRFIPCLILAAAATTAAAAPEFAGKYASSRGGYRQNAEIARTAAGYSVSIVVGTKGCSGLFEGAGTLQDGKLVARLTDADAKDNKCRIEISRNAKGIAVHEYECLMWHGASCDFEGTLRKRR